MSKSTDKLVIDIILKTLKIKKKRYKIRYINRFCSRVGFPSTFKYIYEN